MYSFWIIGVMNLIISISKADAKCPISLIKIAANHIETYNGVMIRNLVFVTSALYDIDNNQYHDEFIAFHSTSSRIGRDVFVQQHRIIAMENSTNQLRLTQRDSFPSMYLIDDMETLLLLKKELDEYPPKDMRDKLWLISLSVEYNSPEEMKKAVLDAMAPFQKYFSKFLVNSQVYVIAKLKLTFRLLEIYQVCGNRPPQVEELIDLSEDATSKLNFIWQRRANLHHCPMRVGYLHGSVYGSVLNNSDVDLASTNVQKLSSKHALTINGMTAHGPSVHMFSMLQSKLNFSIQWVNVTDEKYGVFDEESNDWNGIVGMIKRGEIDTSITDLSITKNRSAVIKFATPHRKYQNRLFMKRKVLSPAWDIFLSVFDSSYWFVLGFFLILCSAVLFSFSLYSKNPSNNALNTLGMRILQFCEAFCTSVKAFLALDVLALDALDQTRVLISSRILVLVIGTCGMLNFYVYNAGLISSLMMERSDLPIEKFSDFLENPQYSLVVLDGGTSQDFLKNAKSSSVYKQVWDKTENIEVLEWKKFWENGEEQMLKDTTKVFFGSSPLFERKLRNSYPCTICASKFGYNQDLAGYGFNENSQYVDLFSYHILNILQNGLDTEDFDPRKIPKDCNDEMNKEFRQFSYKDVISVFAIFVLGCLIAMGYYGIECVYTTRRSSNDELSLRRKDIMVKELQRLRMFDVKAKECLANFERTFTKNMYETYKEWDFDFDNVLYDRNQRNVEMANDLDQRILMLLNEMFPPFPKSTQDQQQSSPTILSDAIQINYNDDNNLIEQSPTPD